MSVAACSLQLLRQASFGNHDCSMTYHAIQHVVLPDDILTDFAIYYLFALLGRGTPLHCAGSDGLVLLFGFAK